MPKTKKQKRIIYHVLPDKSASKKDWLVKKAGSKRASRAFAEKQRAVNFAARLAKKAGLGQVIIHDHLGKIQNEWTYGQDPKRYPS